MVCPPGKGFRRTVQAALRPDRKIRSPGAVRNCPRKEAEVSVRAGIAGHNDVVAVM